MDLANFLIKLNETQFCDFISNHPLNKTGIITELINNGDIKLNNEYEKYSIIEPVLLDPADSVHLDLKSIKIRKVDPERGVSDRVPRNVIESLGHVYTKPIPLLDPHNVILTTEEFHPTLPKCSETNKIPFQIHARQKKKKLIRKQRIKKLRKPITQRNKKKKENQNIDKINENAILNGIPENNDNIENVNGIPENNDNNENVILNGIPENNDDENISIYESVIDDDDFYDVNTDINNNQSPITKVNLATGEITVKIKNQTTGIVFHEISEPNVIPILERKQHLQQNHQYDLPPQPTSETKTLSPEMLENLSLPPPPSPEELEQLLTHISASSEEILPSPSLPQISEEILPSSPSLPQISEEILPPSPSLPPPPPLPSSSKSKNDVEKKSLSDILTSEKLLNQKNRLRKVTNDIKNLAKNSSNNVAAILMNHLNDRRKYIDSDENGEDNEDTDEWN